MPSILSTGLKGSRNPLSLACSSAPLETLAFESSSSPIRGTPIPSWSTLISQEALKHASCAFFASYSSSSSISDWMAAQSRPQKSFTLC